MTNQEVENKEEREKAINFIHTYLHPTGDTDFDKKKLKYRDMAIEALSVDYEGMMKEIEEKKANVNGTYETWQEDKALYTGYEVALSIIRKYAGGTE